MTFHAGTLPMLPVIGESHADPMLGAYVRDAENGEALACCPVAHIPALQTDQFLDSEGRIDSRIVVALATLRLLLYCESDHPKAIPQHVAGPNLLNPPWGQAWRVADFPWMPDTPVLFVVGEVNARIVFRSIPTHVDVPVHFPAEALARIPAFPATAVLTAESVHNVIDAQLAPMFRALELLRDLGLHHLSLHSISPCTLDDAQFKRELLHDTRALTRYKIIMLFNAAMHAWCMRAGFLFIDRWADFTDGGAVREGYLADAVHIREQYMRESLVRLYESVHGRNRYVVAP